MNIANPNDNWPPSAKLRGLWLSTKREAGNDQTWSLSATTPCCEKNARMVSRKDKNERRSERTHLQGRFAMGISWLCSCAIQTAKILHQDTQTLTRNERIAAIAIVGVEEIDEEIIAIRPMMIRLMNLTTMIPTTPVAHDKQDVVTAMP